MTYDGDEGEGGGKRSAIEALTELELHTLELLAQKKTGVQVAFVKIAAARTLCDLGLAVRSHEGWDITPLGSSELARRATPPTEAVPPDSRR